MHFLFKKYSGLIAFVLLLVFLQKTGISLWMHDRMHIAAKKEMVYSHTGNDSQLSVKCTCVDEFLAPLALPDTASVFVYPVPSYCITQAPIATVPAATVPSGSLRGPPHPLYIQAA